MFKRRRNPFTRFKLHGRITWCLRLDYGWIRAGRRIIRWEKVRMKDDN